MATPKRHGTLSLIHVLEQLQNDSDSGKGFDLEENDPLFDSGCSFEAVSLPAFQPTPSTWHVLYLSMPNETSDIVCHRVHW